MKFKLHLLTLLLVLSMGTLTVASSTILTTVQVSGSDQINPGDSFAIDIQLDNNALTDLLGITYFIQLNTPSGSGLFSLTGRSVTSSPFTDLTTSDGTALASPSNLLDPINNSDLGGLEPSLNPVLPAMGIFIAHITLSSSPSVAPGIYSFQLVGNLAGSQQVQVSDSSFNSLNAGSPTVSVTVVPEPSTFALLLVPAGIFLLASGKRGEWLRNSGRRA